MRSRKKKGIGFFSKSILVFNLAAAVFLLFSYCASFINPSSFWPVAFFGLAYPFLLAINIAFIIYWILRKPVLSLISLAVILIGLKFLLSTIGFRGSTAIRVPKSSQKFLRIMTWNVHYFKKFDDKGESTVINQMVDVIRNEQPDIICIQEYFTRRKGKLVMRKLLTEILNSKHYYLQETWGNEYETNGIAIFSKLPIKNKGQLLFSDPASSNQAIYSDFEHNKHLFRVYNVHLQSISFQPEDYEYLKNVKDINTDMQSSRRIGARLKNAFIKRSQQAEKIKRHADSTGLPYIVAGDFNDTPISYAVNTIGEDMSNSFRKKGSGFGITYNGDFPNFQIDYIFLTPHFEVKNYIIIKEKLSDHYPIRSDVEFK